MQRTAVPLAQAYKLLNHGPVTLVGSAHAGRANVMAAAWAMPLDFQPPKVAVVIDKGTFSRGLIEASGQFTLMIPGKAQAEAVLALGNRSGRDGDKLAALGLEWEAGEQVAAPLLEGCAGWLECKVIPEPHNQQAYDLFLGEVVAAWADPRAFRDGRWQFANEELRTLHYVAGGQFFVTGESLVVGE